MTNPYSPHRLCCMISGSGRTALNLLDTIVRGGLHATLALIIASDEHCPGVARCRDRGLTVVVMPGIIEADTLGRVLQSHAIDVVALCGYLKLVRVPTLYQGRIVNIHPALLPKYGGKGMHGLRVHEAVLAARESESGCTVHLADEHFDTGRILLQLRCKVWYDDTPQSLAERVFELECEAFPRAIRELCAVVPRLTS